MPLVWPEALAMTVVAMGQAQEGTESLKWRMEELVQVAEEAMPTAHLPTLAMALMAALAALAMAAMPAIASVDGQQCRLHRLARQGMSGPDHCPCCFVAMM